MPTPPPSPPRIPFNSCTAAQAIAHGGYTQAECEALQQSIYPNGAFMGAQPPAVTDPNSPQICYRRDPASILPDLRVGDLVVTDPLASAATICDFEYFTCICEIRPPPPMAPPPPTPPTPPQIPWIQGCTGAQATQHGGWTEAECRAWRDSVFPNEGFDPGDPDPSGKSLCIRGATGHASGFGVALNNMAYAFLCDSPSIATCYCEHASTGEHAGIGSSRKTSPTKESSKSMHSQSSSQIGRASCRERV